MAESETASQSDSSSDTNSEVSSKASSSSGSLNLVIETQKLQAEEKRNKRKQLEAATKKIDEKTQAKRKAKKKQKDEPHNKQKKKTHKKKKNKKSGKDGRKDDKRKKTKKDKKKSRSSSSTADKEQLEKLAAMEKRLEEMQAAAKSTAEAVTQREAKIRAEAMAAFEAKLRAETEEQKKRADADAAAEIRLRVAAEEKADGKTSWKGESTWQDDMWKRESWNTSHWKHGTNTRWNTKAWKNRSEETDRKKEIECRFFAARGYCRNNDNCRFAHIGKKEKITPNADDVSINCTATDDARAAMTSLPTPPPPPEKKAACVEVDPYEEATATLTQAELDCLLMPPPPPKQITKETRKVTNYNYDELNAMSDSALLQAWRDVAVSV